MYEGTFSQRVITVYHADFRNGDAQNSPAEYIVASHFILPEVTCNQVKKLQLYTLWTSEMGMLKTVLQST